jgi:hypothetical protein
MPFVAGAATLICSALFMFSSTDGNITVQGDDVWFISHMYVGDQTYFGRVASRGYLTRFYSFLFDLCGASTQWTHVVWFVALAISALMLYAIPGKLLGAAPALLASLLYLGYLSKYEILTWLSAGAYGLAALAGLLSVWIAISSRLGPWTKSILITIVNWLVVHLCEILFTAAPLYPLAVWLHNRLRGQRTTMRALAPTFLPLAMFLCHALLIYLNTPRSHHPLWYRPQPESMGMAASLWNGFKLSLDAAVGHRHWRLLIHGLAAFYYFVPIGAWTACTGILALAGGLFVVSSAAVVRPRKELAVPMAVAGLYLFVISPLIGFSTNTVYMPPRLLTLAGFGLSLFAGLIAAYALASGSRIVRWAISAIMLTTVCLDMVAMNSLLYEHQTAWAYDSRIQTQLLATRIQPRFGDTIFLSLPQHPLRPLWKTGFSQFESGYPARLLLALQYGLIAGKFPAPIDQRLVYEREIRGSDEPIRRVVAAPGKRAFCFAVSDGDFQLTPLSCDRIQARN